MCPQTSSCLSIGTTFAGPQSHRFYVWEHLKTVEYLTQISDEETSLTHFYAC
jgi:hypothetical protein